ncbi:hypothetical protein SNOG_01339 [Parastagonospora nodorum SN15]|uniref:Uncharacterized protein n=1 Tax=Phaeosphaeria nodorum (strain SN15 / ATCC MYA-4574 / FGSC 10173) TaxID=321614 RepID=Q0V3S5_PHANO|nr:hypothetical protein SNOG_01339 [Parastagonospora nodorum SN15]EAT90988.1 hypothetical protein SNOG_01339 [Parastagonospora nodorum SN15]
MPAMNTSRNRSTLHVASTTPYNRLINPSHSQNPTSQSPLPTNFAQYLSRPHGPPRSHPQSPKHDSRISRLIAAPVSRAND